MTIRVCELSYPWASIIAMLLDKMLKSFLRFQWSENKARDKRLFHIWYLQCDSHHSENFFPMPS